MSWGKHLVFRDSYQILSGSLCTLVDNLAKDDKTKFKQLNAGFEDSGDHLLRKGVFPYDWFDDVAKLNELALPPIESFRSTLTQTVIYNYIFHV